MATSDHDAAALHERLLDDTEAAITSKNRQPSPPIRRMSVVERLMLSPYEKWRAHGRFPFKIALHALLLALTLLQMALYGAQNASYMRASHRNWAYFFLPPSQDVGVAPRFQRDLYTLNQTRDAVFFLRDAYFSVVNTSLANYEYQRDPQFPLEPIRRLELTVVTRRRGASNLVTRHYRVAAEPRDAVGPFLLNPHSQRQQSTLIRSLESATFTLHLRDRQFGRYYDECFDWVVRVTLRSEAHARLHAVVDDASVASCSTTTPSLASSSSSLWKLLQRRFVWLHLVIALVTTVYLLLSGRALLRSVRLLQRASHRAQVSLPWTLRLQLVNRLQLVVFTALSLQLGSSCWSLSLLQAHVPLSYWHRAAQGAALLLLWSSLVGYLEHNRQIYSIVLTLRWGAPRVLQFLVGVSPIFVGFALFGCVYFGATVQAFGSLSAAMVTLFAVLNGDVILDTFDALALHGFTLSGKVYMYAFIALFIYVVLNIFIAIVEEAFFATRNTRRLLDVMLTDPKYAATNVAAAAPSSQASSEMARLLLQLVDESA